MKGYREFLKSKESDRQFFGFKPLWLPDCLFDFQGLLVDWAVRIGRGAILADCGLGKSLMELVWCENVVRKTGRDVLILTPLAVAQQMIREGRKFGIEAKVTREGKVHRGINVTNYERLHYFRPSDFEAVVLDESGILKSFGGKTRRAITDFQRKVRYRLLCSATPAPNDFVELGNSSEALGGMDRNAMLRTFFLSADDPVGNIESTHHWRLKSHSKRAFWRWVASWARAVRKPSDLGFPDGKFKLPELTMRQHEVPSFMRQSGLGVFPTMARTLHQQRAERRGTLQARCEKAAEVIPGNRPAVIWCHLNAEGDLLKKLIPGAVQVAGSNRDEEKEERFLAFADGQIRVLVTKPRIGGFGLNWQHCSDMTFFPSHSFEQFYQSIRRCWRFGQEREVTVHLVTSKAESLVLNNMRRKERQADEMYTELIRNMEEFQRPVQRREESNGYMKVEAPRWLKR